MKAQEKISDKIIKIFIYLIWLFLIIAGITDSLNNYLNSIIWFGSLALLIFFYFKFDYIPKYIHLLFALALMFNIFGTTLFKLFYYLGYYDKIVHLINPIIICIFIYQITKIKIKNKKLLAIFCVFAALSLGVLWEIFEYSLDSVLGSTSQGVYLEAIEKFFFIKVGQKQVLDKFNDTMQDLIYNFFGTLIFLFLSYIYNTKKMLGIKNNKK